MRFLTKLSLIALFCLLSAVSAFAAPSMTISPTGNGTFVLQGSGFHSIGGLQLTVRYDTATLRNPRVTKGGLLANATFTANTNNPGSIILGSFAEHGFSGSGGVIATFKFDLPGNSPGVIHPVNNAFLFNLQDSRRIPVQVAVINPSGTEPTSESVAGSSDGSSQSGDPADAPGATTLAETPTPTVTTDTTTTVPRGPSQPVAVGSVPASLVTGDSPSAPHKEPEPEGAELLAEVAQEPERPASAMPEGTSPTTATDAPGDAPPHLRGTRPAEEKTPSRTAYRSVIEQFRTFTGQRTPKALSEIFTRHALPGISQEPAIALTDGSSKLRLLITLRSAGNSAPNFSLSEAKLVSLQMEDNGKWLLEVLPAKGASSATLTVLQSGQQTVIPLLVAPPLPRGNEGKLTESGFAQFLAERGTEMAPRSDLNGDGRRDYLDDYIFTANYLLRKGDLAGERPGRNDGQGRKKALSVGASSLPGKGAEGAK